MTNAIYRDKSMAPRFVEGNQYRSVSVYWPGRVYGFTLLDDGDPLVNPMLVTDTVDDNDAGFNNWQLTLDTIAYPFDPALRGYFYRAMNPVSGNPSDRTPIRVFIGIPPNPIYHYMTGVASHHDDYAVSPINGTSAWQQYQ